MANVRGKFTVSSVTPTEWDPKSANVYLNAQYSENLEDNSYAAATPSGNIQMVISNPDALAHFEAGKAFYVDFIEVPAA